MQLAAPSSLDGAEPVLCKERGEEQGVSQTPDAAAVLGEGAPS